MSTILYPFGKLVDPDQGTGTQIRPFGNLFAPDAVTDKCYNALFGKGNYEAPDPALKGHWELQDDAASTTVVDRSGNGLNGTLTGAGNTSASTVAGPTTWLPKALTFNGTSHYVNLNTTFTNLPQSGHSVLFRLKRANTTNYELFPVVGRHDLGQDCVYAENHPNSGNPKTNVYHRPGGTNILIAERFAAIDTEWFSAGISISGTSSWGTQNGVDRSTSNTPDALDFTPNAIGRGLNDWCPGNIADVSLWSRALSIVEQQEWHYGPEPYLSGTAPSISGTAGRGSKITIGFGVWNGQSNTTNTGLRYHYELYSYSNTSGGDERLEKQGSTLKTSQDVWLRGSAIVGRYLRAVVWAENDGGIDPIEIYSTAYTSVVTKGTPTPIVTSGLVGHWSMTLQADGAGTIYDLAGNNDLTVTNATWVTDNSDGGTDAMLIDANSEQLGPSAGSSIGPIRTFSWWFKGSTSNGYVFDANTPARRIAGFQSGQPSYYDGTTWHTVGPIPDSVNWHHLVLTIDDDTNALKCYMDGDDVTVGSVTPTPLAASAFVVGNRYTGGTQPLGGSLDSLRVYDRAITPAEVTELYEAGRGEETYSKSENALCGRGTHLPDPRLNAHYECQDSPSSGVVVDRARSRNATLSGTFTQASGPGNWLANALQTAIAVDGLMTAPASVYGDLYVRYSILFRGRIISVGENSLGRFYDSNASQVCYLSGSNTQFTQNGSLVDSVPYTLSTWQHWGYARRSGHSKAVSVYLDGVDQVPAVISASAVFSDLSFFNRPALDRQLDGRMCDIAIFNDRVSTVEVNEHKDGPEPLNITAPSFTGTLTEGQVLTAVGGTWDGQNNVTVVVTVQKSYQWYRADDAAGTNAVAIGGATSSTYTLVAGDVGKHIGVRERGTNDGGYDAAEDTWSAYSGSAVVSGASKTQLSLTATIGKRRTIAAKPPAGGGSYSASLSLTAGAPSVTISATSNAPSYNTSADLTTGAPTVAISATHSPPISPDATADLVVGAAQISVSSTNTPPVFSANADLTAPGATIDATATHTIPTFSGLADLLTGGALIDLTATNTSPSFGATVDLLISAPSITVTASHTVPTFSGVTDLTVGGATVAVSATFALQLFEVSADLTTGPSSITVTASYDPGVMTAAMDLISPGPQITIAAANTPPVFSGGAGLIAPAPSADLQANFDSGTFSASSDLQVGTPTIVITATRDAPIFSASVGLTAPGPQIAAAVDYNAGTFTGVVTLITGAVSIDIAADNTLPDIVPAGVIVVMSAIIAVSGCEATMVSPECEAYLLR